MKLERIVRWLIYLFIIFFVNNSFAQTFRIKRPVDDQYQIHGGYLYGETNFGYPHKGVDFQTPLNTPVYSATDGIVYWKDYEPTGCGYYVMIQSKWNNKDIWFLYCHLNDHSFFNINDSVYVGDQIALSGNTGNSTGPHMHFEIRQNTASYSGYMNRRNPELWTAIAGMGAIYGKVPNAPDGTRVDITPDPKPRPPYTTYGYSLTYTFDGMIGIDDVYQENYAIGEVKPGTYTITSINGYSRTVTVNAGELVNADAITGIKEQKIIKPEIITLASNYPNPFNNSTTITYSIKYAAGVDIKIYNLHGEIVHKFTHLDRNQGTHQIRWDASGKSSGIYIVQMAAFVNGKVERKSFKMTLLQ